jgi:hypothetical protein
MHARSDHAGCGGCGRAGQLGPPAAAATHELQKGASCTSSGMSTLEASSWLSHLPMDTSDLPSCPGATPSRLRPLPRCMPSRVRSTLLCTKSSADMSLAYSRSSDFDSDLSTYTGR